MINADSLEVEVSSIGTIEGEVSSVNSIEGELNNTTTTAEVTLQEKSVTPSTSQQNIVFDNGYDGLSKVVVEAVDSSIDPDIKASNIKTGVNILGVTGTLKEYVEPKLQEKTVSPSTSSQSVTPDSSYDGLSKVTVNAMATTTQATPSISVSSSGLITASSTQTAGYVSAGTKSSTKQLTTKGATTYTPNTSNQTISSGTYLTGTQTIKGDVNLVASNIKKDVSIFGVTGTLEESVAEDLSAELTAQSTLLTNQGVTIDDIKLALQNKTAGSGEEIVLQEKTITPSTSQQNVIADTGYNGLSKVVVNAVTSSIDSNIQASNIKSGVSILGVTGTLEESVAEDLTSEFNEYETELTEQETTIEDIFNALQGKTAGGGSINTIGSSYNTSDEAVEINIEKESGFLEDGATYHIKWVYQDQSITEDVISISSFPEAYGIDGFEGEGQNSKIEAIDLKLYFPNISEDMYLMALSFKTTPSTTPTLGIITKQ